jgi:hypothetical protein
MLPFSPYNKRFKFVNINFLSDDDTMGKTQEKEAKMTCEHEWKAIETTTRKVMLSLNASNVEKPRR